MIGYDIGMRDYDSALACFEQYVDGLVKMEANLREAPYFTEIYPDVKVLSNGEYVDLQDFRREVWDTMQKEGYLKEIRKDKRFAESYKKFRLFVDWNSQKKGYGRELLRYWEEEMRLKGCGIVMTSTQVDESAQHFYRKSGYQDAGGLVFNLPGYEQPMELFLVKAT